MKMEWLNRAACRDEDPELFFPSGDKGPSIAQIEQAKRVCSRCPVTDECLKWALEIGDSGVRGGMSEEERREMKRRKSSTLQAPPQPKQPDGSTTRVFG